MNKFIVLYRIEAIMSPLEHPFGFECFADNSDHAEEQCINAYPDCEVVWVSGCKDLEAALYEYWNDFINQEESNHE